MRAIVKKSNLKGNLDIISSKSLAHRYIFCASLANGTSKISNVYLSDDVLATIDVCKKMGAKISINGNELTIIGTNNILKNDDFFVNESGSTLRFLIPLLLLDEKIAHIDGKGRLGKRPLDVYFDIFKQDNIEFNHQEDYLPLTVKGNLKGGIYQIRGDISSQFITGLLLALPILKNDSKIVLTTKLESKSYVDLTLDVLNKFGIQIINNNYQEFIIKGNQKYKPYDGIVEGDYSQAAFFFVSNCLGSKINIKNILPNSLQGDKKIIDIINDYQNDKTIDLNDNPDLGPILFVLASRYEGKTHFLNTKRLRYKESDRILAMQKELEKVGVIFEVFDNDLYITGNNKYFNEIEFDVSADHRIAISLIIYSLHFIDKAIISGVEAINKSYPDFISDVKLLGGDIACEN